MKTQESIQMIIKLANSKEYIVTYINKKIKNMKLTVKANNEIIVSGKNLKEKDIIMFITKYSEWIDKTILKNNTRSDNVNYDGYLEGKIMWVFGNEYAITYEDIQKYDLNHCNIYNNKFIIKDNKIIISSKYKSADVFKLVKEHFKTYLIDRVDYYSSIFGKKPNLVLKDMKSKYGYNRYQDNIICLSKRLIHFPKDFIDYVIIHEFCHYYVHNHSNDFYSEVIKYMPNYKEILRRAKKYSLLIKY